MTEHRIDMIKKHICRESFCNWQQQKLTNQEEDQFLEHIGACTFCAEQFGSWMEEALLPDGNLKEACNQAEPPKYLADEIRSRIRQIDVRVSVQLYTRSRQVQLMMYSLRVGLAVAASIFLLTVTSGIQNMSVETPDRQQPMHTQEEKRDSLTDMFRQGSSRITDTLNDMATGLLHMEFGSSENEQD